MKLDEEISCGTKDERWERERESLPNEWGIGGSEKYESSVTIASSEETPGRKVEGFHGGLTSDEVVGDPKETN